MMQGTLYKPITDQSTHTFAQRCRDLGLCVVTPSGLPIAQGTSSGHGTTGHPAPAVGESTARLVQDACERARATGQPVETLPGALLAWVADPHGPADGLGVLCPRQGEERITDHARELADLLSEGTPRGADELGTLAQTLAWTLADLRRLDQNNFAVEDLTNQLGQSYENITLLYRIGQSMSSLDAPRELAESICDQMRMTQGFGWTAARFMADEGDVSGLTNACVVAGDLPCSSQAIRETTGQMLAAWDSTACEKLLQTGQHPLADLVGGEVIVDPIRHDGRVIGLVLAGGKIGPDAEATSGDTQLLDAIAGFLGAFHENASRFTEQKNMFIGSLEAVSAALDAKDRYTFGHSERVALLGTRLAEAIGLDENEVERIRISGLVHDVGKIGVPESVLCKTGKLNETEFEQIKKHPRIGYNILKGIPKMADVLDGVLYHHERWDGKGYPDRLVGEAIPLYGRILAVADTFDAMSSTRSYRQAMPREEVLVEISNCSGTQFDPALIDPFLSMDLDEYDALAERHQGTTEPEQAGQAA